MLMKQIDSKAQAPHLPYGIRQTPFLYGNTGESIKKSDCPCQAENEVIVKRNRKVIAEAFPSLAQEPHAKVNQKSRQAASYIDRPSFFFKKSAPIQAKIRRRQIHADKPGKIITVSVKSKHNGADTFNSTKQNQ